MSDGERWRPFFERLHNFAFFLSLFALVIGIAGWIASLAVPFQASEAWVDSIRPVAVPFYAVMALVLAFDAIGPRRGRQERERNLVHAKSKSEKSSGDPISSIVTFGFAILFLGAWGQFILPVFVSQVGNERIEHSIIVGMDNLGARLPLQILSLTAIVSGQTDANGSLLSLADTGDLIVVEGTGNWAGVFYESLELHRGSEVVARFDF